MLPLLLVISFDALMFQYFNLSQLHLPNFDYLQRRGILAPLEPQFTSKTFPNHWAMITGLYEDSSNIVDNYMYDPDLGFFSFQAANDTTMAQWLTHRYSGEPIWMSNERTSSGPRNSGVYMWPGSIAANVNNSFLARHMVHYNDSISRDFRKGADTIVDWMATKDVNLAMLYYPEPDEESHKNGPFSLEVMQILNKIDDDLGYLIRKLKVTQLWPRMNIMLLSDHGMAEIGNVIDISLVENDAEVLVDNACVLQVKPKPGKEDNVMAILQTFSHVTVYRKEQLPERFHYVHSERILPIIALADEGFAFQHGSDPYPLKGQHGYDPALPSMHGFFLGSGPKFRSDTIRKTAIQPVDAHAIMAFILGATVPPNNGSLKRVEDMLNLDYYDILARKLQEQSVASSASSSYQSFSSSVAIGLFHSINWSFIYFYALSFARFFFKITHSKWLAVVVTVVCAVVISIIFIVRILCNRRYTILNIRGEQNGLMALQSLRSKNLASYRTPGDKGDALHEGQYALLSTTPDDH